MYGIGAKQQRSADERWNVEVALGHRGGADTDPLIGQTDMQRPTISGRVDRHRWNVQRAAGTHDAHRDLAAVGDQDFFKHNLQPFASFSERFQHKQGLPVLDRLVVVNQDFQHPAPRLGLPRNSASISFIIFMASMIQTTSPFSTTAPTST